MEFLHSFVPPIAHRDLRSPNVFICSLDHGANVVAKVADFGLSTFVSPKAGGVLETWNWLPPEAFADQIATQNYNYDQQIDVYSFAIVMWEVVTRKYPFEEDYENLFKRGRFFDDKKCREAVIHDQLRPPIDRNVPAHYCLNGAQWGEYCDLMIQSWSHRPSDRPEFRKIVAILSRIYESC